MPISRFPFFNNPYYYNRAGYYNANYYKNSYNGGNYKNKEYYTYKNNVSQNTQNIEKKESKNPKNEDNSSKKNNQKSSINMDNYFFELFGLKLYFDDILLICLIFFLYEEGVKDDELFISLILLLLS